MLFRCRRRFLLAEIGFIIVVAAGTSPRVARERHPPAAPGGRRIPRTGGFVPNDAGWSRTSSSSRSILITVRGRTTAMLVALLLRRWHSGGRHGGHDARHGDVGQERRRAGVDRVDGHLDAAGHRGWPYRYSRTFALLPTGAQIVE